MKSSLYLLLLSSLLTVSVFGAQNQPTENNPDNKNSIKHETEQQNVNQPGLIYRFFKWAGFIVRTATVTTEPVYVQPVEGQEDTFYVLRAESEIVKRDDGSSTVETVFCNEGETVNILNGRLITQLLLKKYKNKYVTQDGAINTEFSGIILPENTAYEKEQCNWGRIGWAATGVILVGTLIYSSVQNSKNNKSQQKKEKEFKKNHRACSVTIYDKTQMLKLRKEQLQQDEKTLEQLKNILQPLDQHNQEQPLDQNKK